MDELSAVFREPVIPAVEVKRQSHVIETHHPQHGCMEVAHVIRRLHRMVAERIGRADEGAGSDARAREPDGRAPGL